MINSFKNPAIMRILRTTERYEAGWREQNFIPDDEAYRLILCRSYDIKLQKQAILRASCRKAGCAFLLQREFSPLAVRF